MAIAAMITGSLRYGVTDQVLDLIEKANNAIKK